VLFDRHDELVREFMALDYAVIERNRAEALNLMPAEWPAIRSLLDARPRA
jgi:hypothetical protein